MSASGPGVWGIDLGQAGLKALRLQKEGDGVVATAFDYVEHSKLLSQPDADREALVREALEKFLSRNSLKGDQVCISVPGQSGLFRLVKLPPVAENKIPDIVKFEAKQQIPFSLEEVVWDFQKIGAGMVIDGMAIDTEIGLFAMKRDIIGRELAYFKDVGVEIHQVQMNSMALCNYAVYDQLGLVPPKPGDDEDLPSGKCVAVLEIGAELTNLVISDGNKIILQRTINVAGNSFTKALTKDLKLTFAKAVLLNRTATKSLPKEGPDLKTILTSLRPVFNDLQNEVQRSLTYFQNAHRSAEITKIVGLGNAFHLPGLQRFLQEKLQIEIQIPKAFEKVTGAVLSEAPFKENILTFAVAYGLAIQGLKLAKIQTNLLPPEIRMERLIKAKKPWVALTAASMLLGISTCGFNTYMQARPFIDEGVQKQVKDSGAVKNQVENGKKTFGDLIVKTGEEKKAVETIVAGQQERANWLEMMAFLQDAIPRPDGSNIYAEKAKPYFEGELDPNTKKYVGIPDEFRKRRVLTGKRAYEIYAGKVAAGVEQGEIDSTASSGIDDMVQVSVTSVDCRFFDNLSSGFWTPVKKKIIDGNLGKSVVRPENCWTTPPDGKGWVVELRGYTFHWNSSKFLTEAVLENMAKVGMRKVVAAKAAANPSTPADPMALPEGAPGLADAGASGPPDMGPVINRISHLTLIRYYRSPNMSRNGFLVLDNSLLGELAKGGGAAKAGGGMAMPGMAGGEGSAGPGAAAPGGAGGAGSARSSWVSLLGPRSAAGMGGAGMAGGEGPGGAMKPGMAMGMPGMGGGGEGAGAPATEGAAPAEGAAPGAAEVEGSGEGGDSTGEIIQRGARKRTEFVILFVWKEPTPSDALRGSMSAAAGLPEGGDAAAVPEAGAEPGAAPSGPLFSKNGSPAEPRTLEKAKARKERPIGLPSGTPPAPEIKVLAPPKPKAPEGEKPMGEANPMAPGTPPVSPAIPVPGAVAPVKPPVSSAPMAPGVVAPGAPPVSPAPMNPGVSGVGNPAPPGPGATAPGKSENSQPNNPNK